MKKLLCLMGGVMLVMNLCGQPNAEHFLIGRKMPDLPLERIINYKDSACMLSSFGNKLIIIDFWSTKCGPCVESFPRLDSIQRKLQDRVQFILITSDSIKAVTAFLDKYNKNKPQPLSIPIIYGEHAILQLLSHFSIPSFAFIEPRGRLQMQITDETIITEPLIKSIVKREVMLQKRLESYGTRMPRLKDKSPNSKLIKRLKENKHIQFKQIYLF